MSKHTKIRIQNSKFRDFSIFLLLSFLAWMITRLSESYTYEIQTQIRMEKVPEDLILVGEKALELPVKIRSNGFQLLRYQLLPKHIALNLEPVAVSDGKYYLPAPSLNRQITEQLPLGSSVLQLPSDTLFLNLQQLQTKIVPVQVDLDLQLAQNFMLDGALRVSPSEIQVVGPAEEIDSLRFLSTQPLVLQQVDADFDLDLPLSLDIKLEKSKLSTAQVRVSGTVFRFTEALVTVPVVVSNLPERLQIKTFPPEVQVLCSGRVEAVKNLGPNDFSVVADFRNPDPLTGRLKLELKAFPARIHSAVLRETSVEFIIRRQ